MSCEPDPIAHWTARLAAEPLPVLAATALALALPATVLLLFINLALGFASRVAPQLSIFSVGFPVTVGAGLLLLTLGTGHLLGPMLQGLEVFLAPLR